MRQELCDPQPGDFVVSQQLATMVLVEALRIHLSVRRRDEVGVGLSPMEYLTRWRMMLAADRLTNSRNSVAEIGLMLGYMCPRNPSALPLSEL